MQLTPQQDQVLALISAGSTISQAARSAGAHRNSIHNWLRSAPPFQLAFAHARRAKADYWQEQAEELAADAVQTIRTLMTGADTPAAVRLKAALSILTLATTPPSALQAESSQEVHNSAQPHPAAPAPPGIPPSALEAESSQEVHNSAQPHPAAPAITGIPPSAPEAESSQEVHNSAQPAEPPAR